MKILVIGATGFIGRHLVRELAKKTKNIRCLVRKKSDIKALEKLKLDFYWGDILNKASLIRSTKNIDIVFHLVGIGSIADFSQHGFLKYKKINVNGIKNLLEACQKNKVKGVVYFSSLAAQGVIPDKVVTEKTRSCPQTPYEKSKYLSELIVEKYRKKNIFPISIIRPAMVYGPEAEVSDILFLAKLVQKQLCPIIGDGKNILPLVYVKDLVRAVAKLVDKSELPNKTYNITRENPVKYKELLECLKKVKENHCMFIHIPKGVAKAGAYLLKFASLLTQKPPMITPLRIDSITANRLYDVSLAQKELDFCSSNFPYTIKETINWYKKNQCL